MKPLVSQKLRDSANGETCVACGWDLAGEVVLAHLPGATYGAQAGTAQKCHDFIAAFLCSRPGGCHEYADGDGRYDYQWRLTAMVRTQERFFERGVLRVA